MHWPTPYILPQKENFRRTLAGMLLTLLGDRSQGQAKEFNVANLRAKLTAMEPTTWR